MIREMFLITEDIDKITENNGFSTEITTDKNTISFSYPIVAGTFVYQKDIFRGMRMCIDDTRKVIRDSYPEVSLDLTIEIDFHQELEIIMPKREIEYNGVEGFLTIQKAGKFIYQFDYKQIEVSDFEKVLDQNIMEVYLGLL